MVGQRHVVVPSARSRGGRSRSGSRSCPSSGREARLMPAGPGRDRGRGIGSRPGSAPPPAPRRRPSARRTAWRGCSPATAEADARVAHRDHRDVAQATPEGVDLHRHPAAGAGVLHNILARFGKRHTEAHRGVALEAQLPWRMRDAVSLIFSTTWCPSSIARTGVTSRSTSLGPVAVALGTRPWRSEHPAAWRKKPTAPSSASPRRCSAP